MNIIDVNLTDSMNDIKNNKRYHKEDQQQQRISYELMKLSKYVCEYHRWLIMTIEKTTIEFEERTNE